MKMNVKEWLLMFGLASLFGQSCSQSSDAPSPTVTCYGLSDRKVFRVSWQAVKNNGDVVKGEILGKGTLDLSSSGDLNHALFELEFDVYSLDSFNSLRNERLWNYFFKSNAFPVIEYKGVIEEIDNALLPEPGETRKIKIRGPLTMAGQRIELALQADIINQNGVIFVRENASALNFIDVKATDGLSTNVDQLLHTADVSGMDRRVKLSGSMPLIQPCPG